MGYSKELVESIHAELACPCGETRFVFSDNFCGCPKCPEKLKVLKHDLEVYRGVVPKMVVGIKSARHPERPAPAESKLPKQVKSLLGQRELVFEDCT